MLNCFVVGIGGFLGSVCRYLIGLLPIYESTVFPIKTLFINILGAFAIGLIVFSAHESKFVDPKVILLLKVGVCGGFTTFSTFAEETFGLIQKGAFAVAFFYIFSSVFLGIGAVIAAKSIAG
ncbi:MAG: fluoride efflux transporter CrcB [Fibrobacter sp.]|nr:fluoride efflux transporter CrcB [Fibrobacter sp.]